jgi:hypothetical protein
MKTAEDVAEEILKEIESNNSMKLFPHFDTHPDPRSVIAHALNAFAEDRVKENNERFMDVRGFHLKKARAEALEDVRRYIDEKLANKS